MSFIPYQLKIAVPRPLPLSFPAPSSQLSEAINLLFYFTGTGNKKQVESYTLINPPTHPISLSLSLDYNSKFHL